MTVIPPRKTTPPVRKDRKSPATTNIGQRFTPTTSIFPRNPPGPKPPHLNPSWIRTLLYMYSIYLPRPKTHQAAASKQAPTSFTDDFHLVSQAKKIVPHPLMPLAPSTLNPVDYTSFITTGTVMQHILSDLLGEKMPNGPIKGALANNGYTEPQELMLMDPKGLLTNRSLTGYYLEVPTYLRKKQIEAIENLRSYHDEILRELDSHGQTVYITYKEWMDITCTDLMLHLSQKEAKDKADLSAMWLNIEQECMEVDDEEEEVEYE